MKKKIVSIIMALACASTCAVALTACGGGDGSKQPKPDTAKVTQEEWTAALSNPDFVNLTAKKWSYKEEATDIDDLTTNKQNAESIDTMRTGSVDNVLWVSFDYEYTENPENNNKLAFKVQTTGEEYAYNTDTSKWYKSMNKNEAAMERDLNKWKSGYGFNALTGQVNNYAGYTYDKTEKSYKHNADGYHYEIEFKDKKLIRFVAKYGRSVTEIYDFGSTTVEAPTVFEAVNVIGHTFYLTDVKAYNSSNEPSTDQTVLGAAEQTKTNNLNKTAVCKVQSMGGGIDGVLNGTCNFGSGVFDELTGDNKLYWRYESSQDYFGDFTVKTMDSSFQLSGNYNHEVLTIKYPVDEQGDYLELIFRIQ